MTIRWDCAKDDCYVVKNLPDWSMLAGCFGDTRVSPADIDGVVYQNGKCLFLEKKFPNGILEQPQIRMIRALVGQGNCFIAVWCEARDGSDISYMRVWGLHEYDPERRYACCLTDFRAAVRIWWQHVHDGRCI